MLTMKNQRLKPIFGLGLVLVILALLALSAEAIIRDGYRCDPTTCKLPTCQCASDTPPLPLADTPQFVTITFDDGASEFLNADARKFLYSARNPNNCPIGATHFLSRQWTDFRTVEALYKQGYEIADHTVDHIGQPSFEQIENARVIYERWARIPKKDQIGFRAPFLSYNQETFRHLSAAGGFQYDSSMSTNGVRPHWPYTMDHGLADECFTGVCTNLDEKNEGLWEIPMYQLHNPQDGRVMALMDPQGTSDELFEMFKFNFENHWKSSKAPFGIYLHTAWIISDPEARRALLTRFLEWTQTAFPAGSVWWVSNTQLLSWLRNPVPLSTLSSNPPDYLSCGAANVGPNQRIQTMDISETYNPCGANPIISCMYDDYSWKYCLAPGETAGCPRSQPSVDEPIPLVVASDTNVPPPQTGGCSQPSAGCSFGRWNATQCTCFCLGAENATADASGRQGFCKDAAGSCTLEKVVDPRDNRYLTCEESALARGNDDYFDGEKTSAAPRPTGTLPTDSAAVATPTSSAEYPEGPQGPLAPPPESRTVPIAGIVGGAVAAVTLGFVGLLIWRQRRRHAVEADVEPPHGKLELPSDANASVEVLRSTHVERTVSGLSPTDMVRRGSTVA